VSSYYEHQVKPWLKKEIKKNPDFLEKILSDIDRYSKDVLK
jgi:hypothetical protein